MVPMIPLFVEKYTPQLLEEFNLYTPMLNSLHTLLATSYLNLLLVGNMGTGKTTILNAIIRKYYSGISENQYKHNILYINNLHDQGINYYRSEVKTFCQTSSAIKHKKKIVVLDDIDIINEQSQQVFRNCIDKYSHNVCFMASCSNNQKVIDSIQSRLTLMKLPSITTAFMYPIFNNIVKKENIRITKEATDFIVSISNNTIKILVNYAEKCKLVNKLVDYELALKLCSDIDLRTFDTYTEHVKQNELKEAIMVLYTIVDNGYSVMDILDNYFIFVKSTHLLSETQKYQIVPFICKYITTFHDVHENDIELPLFTNNLIQALTTK